MANIYIYIYIYIGVILLGDLNIHHTRWLQFSNSNTSIGDRLWDVCRDLGLKQLVAKPTRGEYLLDLVLTDAAALCKVEVLPEISDHRVVSLDINVVASYSVEIPRTVWQMSKANWEKLRHDVSMTNWAALLDDRDPEASVRRFCDAIQEICVDNIPRKTIFTKVASHPWLDASCLEAVAAKSAASGTLEFAEKSRICNETLRGAFVAYRQNLRERILALPRHSKEWWRLNKELLHRKTKSSSIPPLKANGQWISEAKDKANVLAKTFASKSALPPSAPGPKQEGERVAIQMPEFILIRSRLLVGILKCVKLDTASGPDGLPTRIY